MGKDRKIEDHKEGKRVEQDLTMTVKWKEEWIFGKKSLGKKD